MSELHRISAGEGTPQADVIFVHGLDGHPFKTWQYDPDRQTDCWLHWLAEDAPTVAVHTLEYEARSSEWLGRAMPLVDRAKEVLNELARRGVGERPIVFVCHSLGGLLTKQLLRTASDDAALPPWRKIAGQTKGLVFVATPHAGADPARTLRRLGWALRTSAAIDDLRAHDPALRDLNEWYRGYVERRAVRTLCYYETYKTSATRYGWLPLAVKVVEEGDADPGLGAKVRPMPLDAHHISIAKPAKRDHQLYDTVLELVREIVSDVPPTERPSAVDSTPTAAPTLAPAVGAHASGAGAVAIGGSAHQAQIGTHIHVSEEAGRIFDDRRVAFSQRIAEAISTGNALRQQPHNEALIPQINKWIEDTRNMINDYVGPAEAAVFISNDGLVAYGDSSLRSQIRIGIERRMRRLNELVQRLDSLQIRRDCDSHK